MKLLNRLETAQQAASQRKSEIDGGARIASRIDAMRETLASLESQQAEFVRNTKTAVSDTIRELSENRDILLSEVETLKRQRSDLTRPIYEEIAESKRAHMEASEAVERSLAERLEAEALMSRARKMTSESEAQKEKAERRLEAAGKVLAEARKKHELSETILADAQAEAETSTRKAAEKLKSAEMLERRLTYDRRHYQDFLKNLKARERELSLREKRIAARERSTK